MPDTKHHGISYMTDYSVITTQPPPRHGKREAVRQAAARVKADGRTVRLVTTRR